MARKKNIKSPEKRRGLRALAVVLAVLAVLAAAAVGAGAAVTNSGTIFPKVRVEGKDVGGLTMEQAMDELNSRGWDDGADSAVTAVLPLGNKISVRAGDAGAAVSASEAVVTAYDFCHGGNIFANLLTWLRCSLIGADVEVVPDVDEDALRGIVKESVSAVTECLLSSGMRIDGDALCIVKGASSVVIDSEKLTSMIADALRARNYAELKYEVETSPGEEPDFNALYKEVACKPENASYDPESGEIIESVRGIDFDKAEARSLWEKAEPGETVEIPLKITEPEISTEVFRKCLFRDELGTITTYLYGSTPNRIGNVRLAAETVTGTVLLPGEVFSYNAALGERTAARGFKSAPAYAGGEVVQEIGGGICQVSSTIYNAALLANLKIEDRTCHYFGVGYLPPGLDATASWKVPDFKFSNSRDFPIRLDVSVNEEGTELTAAIVGTDVDGTWVKMTFGSWEIFTNEEYPEVATGYKAATFREIYDKNDKLISRELEDYSTYHYHEEDIEYPDPTAEPTPDPTAEPTAEPTDAPTSEPGSGPGTEPAETAPPDSEPPSGT